MHGALGARFKFESVAVETGGVYGESTAALISEIGRHITEATRESRETLRLEQRSGLVMRRGNALSILTAVRENATSNLRPADCLLNAIRSGCKSLSLTFVRGRDPCNVLQFVFLTIDK